MAYISKKLALIAKEEGFDEECSKYYNVVKDKTEEFGYYDLERTNSTIQSGYGGKGKYCTAPTYEQLINWIFKYVHLGSKTPKEHVLWLEFWYNEIIVDLFNITYTLKDEQTGNVVFWYKLPINEFVLEGFVGMLINWFEKNSIQFHPDWHYEGWGYMTYINNSTNQSSTIGTKLQARHEGILKCFQLLKEQHDLKKQYLIFQ